MIIPFGEWLPDQMDIVGGASVLNCAPDENGYVSLNSLTTYSNALDAKCQGFYSTKDTASNSYNIAGDATKLYTLSSTTFSDASKAGGYNLASTDRWEFTKYGNLIIATNGVDEVQSLLMGSSAFEDLSANITAGQQAAPRARTIATVGTHVLLGNVYDYIDGDVPHRVWFGPTNNPQGDWTASVETQCDYRTFAGPGGKVQRIIGGEWATVFQEHAIVRMSLTSAPLTFAADEIEERGTDAPGSVIKLGRFIFYKSQEGFFMFNGEYSEPIGAGKIDKTVLADMDDDYLHNITAQIDPVKKLVKWSYAGSGHSGGVPNKQIIYHWPTGKWSQAEITMEHFANHLLESYTLEELDAFGDLDSLTDSLDSDFWKRGDLTLSAFDSSHRLAQFTGADLSATFETKETQFFPGRKGMVRELRPLIDGGTLTVSVDTRNNQTDSVTTGSSITAASSGRYATRSTARYHRLKLATSGTFTNATGYDVTAKQRGSR